MAGTDKILQVGPTGVRRVANAGFAEVGSGIASTSGQNLAIAAEAGFEIVVNEGALNTDLRAEGTGETHLLFLDASANFIGFGVAAPSSLFDLGGAFTVQGMAVPALSPGGTGRIYFDSTGNKFRISENGGPYTDLLTSSGTGTAGQVAFWSSSSVLTGEGDLFWDAASNFLGIGTPTPATSIEVAAGQVAVPQGLVTAPSFSFVGDLNTGVWSGGGGDVRLATDGTDRVVATSTGVVLTGPTEEIVSGTGTTLTVRMRNSGAGADQKNWAFVFDSAVNANALRLVTDVDALTTPVNVLAIDRAGQVGIGSGITTPGALLDVRGSVIINEDAADVNVRIEGQTEPNLFVTDADVNRIGIGIGAPLSRLHLLEAAAAVDGTKGVRLDNATDVVLLEVGNAGGSYVGTTSSSAFNVRSNNVARITVASAGLVTVNPTGADADFVVLGDTDTDLIHADASTDRVGFGVAAPAGKVEIRDDTATPNLLLTKSSVGVGNNDLAEFRTDAFTSGERHLFKWTSNSGALVIGRYGMEFDGTGNTMDFVWRDMFNTAATVVENMRLKGNGFLGLGTASPNTRFDLAGAFSIRGMTAPAVSVAGQGRLYFDSGTNKWRISEHGGAYQDLLSVGTVGGTGVAGRLAFWTAASTLSSDSDFVWDSTNNRLGIAVGASPNTAIDMTGALSVRAISAPAISPVGEVRLYFDSGTNKTRISENGSAYQDLLSAISGVTGSGAINRVAFWNGGTILTSDAQFFWDNTNNFLGIDVATPTSTLDVGGSVATQVTALAANTNLDATHHIILGNASGGAFTLTLPLASAASGREYRVKKTDSSSNDVTIARSGADTIDGATSQVLGSQYEAISFVSDGTNWFMF